MPKKFGFVQWLKKSLVTGLVVNVPLIISVVAFVWLFQLIDGVMGPLYMRWLGREIPGLGLLTLLFAVLLIGALANYGWSQRVLQRGETYLMRLPVFRAIYGPIKQLVGAFSPDNQLGFKKVVLVDDPRLGFVLGFLTKRFILDRGHDSEELVAVYVPTNHIYLGDIHIYPLSVVSFLDLSIQEGVQIFLTGGMALSGELRVEKQNANRLEIE